ncbi:hypothetical protein NC981_18165 [Leptolyngbya sp. DQ-M1]|uniref:hypothetical protein n=1 Tax=Leptolyngbya sp. DQ-M1 TaxID=2933920 RepID=UPI00329A3565
MNSLDDTELVKKFVEGKISFLANQNLRIEPAFNTEQLLARKGELVATAKLVGQIRAVLVRQSTAYQELVNRILIAQQYIPTRINPQGLIEYEHCPIPVGYQANCTEFRQLWKAWRVHYSTEPKIPLLMHEGKKWLPVEKITFGKERFFIQVPGDEKMVKIDDRIIWLSPVESTAPVLEPSLKNHQD